MHDDTLDAIQHLTTLIEQHDDYHVSSVDADEYLYGGGFDPDDRMGAEIDLTVYVPDPEYVDEADDNPFRVK